MDLLASPKDRLERHKVCSSCNKCHTSIIGYADAVCPDGKWGTTTPYVFTSDPIDESTRAKWAKKGNDRVLARAAERMARVPDVKVNPPAGTRVAPTERKNCGCSRSLGDI